MRARRRVALIVCALLAGCAAAPSDDVSRRTLQGGLCEEIHALARPPGGAFDRVRARRLAPCDASAAAAPVVLYLPGMHMNGALPALGPDLRRTLAASGVHVWSVDYRTHAVPSDATADDLTPLATWTPAVFVDDVVALVELVRAEDPGPFYVVGFSFGGGLAYMLAAHGVPMDGLVVLDGAPPVTRDAGGAGGSAIDVGSTRLPFDARARLLAAVLADPSAASPVPGFAAAGEALAEIVHSSRSFGGNGGLSGVKRGTTDVRALAALLVTYDRWWPRAALAGSVATSSRTVPVLAFAAGNTGRDWASHVRAGALSWGGDRAVVHDLPGFGHLDVLIGRDAPRLVFEPVRRFVLARREPPRAR